MSARSTGSQRGRHFRFAPESRQTRVSCLGPLCAKSGSMHRSKALLIRSSRRRTRAATRMALPRLRTARCGGGLLFVYTDASVPDQLRPLRDFGFNPRCKVRRRIGDDLHAKILQMLARFILFKDTRRLAVKL